MQFLRVSMNWKSEYTGHNDQGYQKTTRFVGNEKELLETIGIRREREGFVSFCWEASDLELSLEWPFWAVVLTTNFPGLSEPCGATRYPLQEWSADSIYGSEDTCLRLSITARCWRTHFARRAGEILSLHQMKTHEKHPLLRKAFERHGHLYVHKPGMFYVESTDPSGLARGEFPDVPRSHLSIKHENFIFSLQHSLQNRNNQKRKRNLQLRSAARLFWSTTVQMYEKVVDFDPTWRKFSY